MDNPENAATKVVEEIDEHHYSSTKVSRADTRAFLEEIISQLTTRVDALEED